MIIHKIIKLMTFDECSPELQKKILDKYRNFETEGGWIADIECEYTSEMLDDKYGFICTAKDIQYDVSYCQGSGASFTCDEFDWDKLLEGLDIKHKKWWCEYLESCCMKIVGNNSRYCHRMTKHWDTGDCKLDYMYSSKVYPYLSKEFERILAYLEDIRLKACDELYKTVEADYEHYESDEYLSQLFIDNEYYFNEEGEIDHE